MVKAIVKIDERANRILNIIKAKYDLNDKSEAINLMARRFEMEIMEPEMRPEFIKRLKASEKEKTIRVKDFAKEFGLKK